MLKLRAFVVFEFVFIRPSFCTTLLKRRFYNHFRWRAAPQWHRRLSASLPPGKMRSTRHMNHGMREGSGHIRRSSLSKHAGSCWVTASDPEGWGTPHQLAAWNDSMQLIYWRCSATCAGRSLSLVLSAQNAHPAGTGLTRARRTHHDVGAAFRAVA